MEGRFLIVRVIHLIITILYGRAFGTYYVAAKALYTHYTCRRSTADARAERPYISITYEL